MTRVQGAQEKDPKEVYAHDSNTEDSNAEDSNTEDGNTEESKA